MDFSFPKTYQYNKWVKQCHTCMNRRLLNWRLGMNKLAWNPKSDVRISANFENLAHLTQIFDNLDWFFLQLFRMTQQRSGQTIWTKAWKSSEMIFVRYCENNSIRKNQLGSKAASDSTLKQLTTCGVSSPCTLLFFKLWWKSSDTLKSIRDRIHLIAWNPSKIEFTLQPEIQLRLRFD